MSEKTGKVKSFAFVKEWVNPQMQTLYVHAIEFENGDKGSCWCKTNMPPQYAPGAELGYELPGNDRVKINRVIVQQPTQPLNTNFYPNKMSESRKVDSIGLAFAHAKDIVVAKINQQTEMMKASNVNKTEASASAKKSTKAPDELFIYDPVQDICSAAEIIYNKMKELRQAELNENDAPPVS
jgi:hypothetical protein